MSEAITLRFPAANFIDAADLGHFLFLFRGAYASCSEISKTFNSKRQVNEDFDGIARKTIKSFNASDIDKLFSKDLGSRSLVVEKITFASPLEIALAGVPVLLCIAVILSGGKFKWGNLQVTLPPIGQGIKNLREALSPTIKARLEYGIKQPEIKLSSLEYKELMKQDPKSKSKGGFQRFLVKLQQKINGNNHVISLSESDIDKIIEYGRDAKKGGWQSRIKKIFGRHFQF